MKPMRFGSIIATSLLVLSVLAFAAPMPLLIIINNSSLECARFLPGDECMDCMPPAGWEILDPYANCPENYNFVAVEGVCKGFEVPRCCTEGHTGASGDCRNLVMNNSTQECAFASDVSNCTLPVGWMQIPENVSTEWLCPQDYNWTTINCTTPG